MLEDLKFSDELETDSKACAICQENFQDLEQIKSTPCKHMFHPGCIGTWLKKECTKPTCPVCRHDCRENFISEENSKCSKDDA